MTHYKWIGDDDPSAQTVDMFGTVFVKGVPLEVKDKTLSAKLSKNPMFSTDAKAELAPADEPTEEELAARSEEGTEKAAIKELLREKGITVTGNPSLDTLRQKLADAHD